MFDDTSSVAYNNYYRIKSPSIYDLRMPVILDSQIVYVTLQDGIMTRNITQFTFSHN